jgi:hypothetical protein
MDYVMTNKAKELLSEPGELNKDLKLSGSPNRYVVCTMAGKINKKSHARTFKTVVKKAKKTIVKQPTVNLNQKKLIVLIEFDVPDKSVKPIQDWIEDRVRDKSCENESYLKYAHRVEFI